jgi:hypothetical protein
MAWRSHEALAVAIFSLRATEELARMRDSTRLSDLSIKRSRQTIRESHALLAAAAWQYPRPP